MVLEKINFRNACVYVPVDPVRGQPQVCSSGVAHLEKGPRACQLVQAGLPTGPRYSPASIF